MDKEFKYTSFASLNRKIGRRANVFQSALIPLDETGVISQTIDPELVEDIVYQVEHKIDVYFGTLYVLPVDERDKVVLKDIVEKFVLAELAISLYDTSLVPSLGGDSGYGGTMLQRAREELKAYFIGTNIYIPGVSYNREEGSTEAHPLILTYTPMRNRRRDLLTPSTVMIGKMGKDTLDKIGVNFEDEPKWGKRDRPMNADISNG